jgi:hypothetical protein
LPTPNPDNNAYFGDVHVHTGWSFDALTNGSKTTPTDAYAWAQGKPITGSGGPEMQIQTPLDFYMVSDHAEYMGVFNEMQNPESPLSKTELAKGVNSPDANVRLQTFAGILRDMSEGKRDPQLSDPALARTVWAEIVKAADANYVPASSRRLRALNGRQIRRSATCIASWSSGTPHTCPSWCCPRSIRTIPRISGSGWTSSAPRVRRCLQSRTTATRATVACSRR